MKPWVPWSDLIQHPALSKRLSWRTPGVSSKWNHVGILSVYRQWRCNGSLVKCRTWPGILSQNSSATILSVGSHAVVPCCVCLLVWWWVLCIKNYSLEVFIPDRHIKLVRSVGQDKCYNQTGLAFTKYFRILHAGNMKQFGIQVICGFGDKWWQAWEALLFKSAAVTGPSDDTECMTLDVFLVFFKYKN